MLNPGSYVTLVPPSKSGDFSIIIETVVGNEGSWCETMITDEEAKILADTTQNVTFVIGPGLSTNSIIYVRFTQFFTADTYFVELPPIKPVGGQFTIELQPNSLYSLSTINSTAKGQYPPPPPIANFTMPYKDDFESYQPSGVLPKYFSDLTGVFEIYTNASVGTVLRQSVPAMPFGWCDNSNPVTIIGSYQYTDYVITTNVLVEGSTGFVALGGRIPVADPCNSVPQSGYWFSMNVGGDWAVISGTKILQNGTTTFHANTWYTMSLSLQGPTITGSIGTQRLFSVSNSTYAAGFAALGTSWHYAQFDNFLLTN